jgi:hypothetical protein
MMVRYSAFLVAAFLVLSSTYVAAQYLPTYTVSSWPDGMSNATFRKGEELKMIEEKCSTK